MRKQPKYAAVAKMGENDINELMKAAENWEHSADGRAFEKDMVEMGKEIENDPAAMKAFEEAVQEF